MDERRCCVCDRRLAPEEGHRLGARDFCPDHFAAALAATRARWTRSGLLEVAAVAAFVALVGLYGGRGPDGFLPSSGLAGLLLATIPALILTVYVYRQDRIEPEPWGAVLGVFALGALLGHGVATPLVRDVFAVGEWRHLSPWSDVVATLLIVAPLQQLCTYLAVRYSVYLTDEFDEPADGVVYACAAGLGLATAANLDFVIRSESVVPFAAAAHIATVCLIHVAAAAALGYGLGRNRFVGHPRQLWLGSAFALSIVLNGGLKQLAVWSGISGGTFRPWLSLSVAAVAVAAILLAVDLLMARLSLENFEREPDAAKEPS
jgi:RsiW-degrading membrane proteinase PrsW (M82 family)